ncbi:MAG: DUF6338 family protein [Candidatus Hermodarchaeota archaeon]
MPTDITALYIFIILLPGFVTSKIISVIAVKKKSSELGQITDALVYTLIDLVLFVFVANLLNLQLTLTTTSESIGLTLIDLELFISLILGIAVIVGIIQGWAVNKDYYYKFLRALKITTKTGRVDVWNDVFNDFAGCIIRIRMNNETSIEGWPDYFSDTAESMSLFLRDVTIWYKDGKKEKIPGLMITHKEDVKLIEFYHEEKLSTENSK